MSDALRRINNGSEKLAILEIAGQWVNSVVSATGEHTLSDEQKIDRRMKLLDYTTEQLVTYFLGSPPEADRRDNPPSSRM